MRILLTIALFSFGCLVQGKDITPPFALTKQDSIFVSNVIKDMKPLTYTATPTHRGVVLVMVYKDYTLIETLVDGFVKDLVELTNTEIIVYPRESE